MKPGGLGNKLRNAAQLAPAEWLLFFQAWFWLLFFDLGLRFYPLPVLRAYAIQPRSRTGPPPEKIKLVIQAAKAAIDHAADNHLHPMTCLRRALAWQKMLTGQGLVTELKIGARKEAGQFSAHAWLEFEGKPLGEPEKITERYPALVKAGKINE